MKINNQFVGFHCNYQLISLTLLIIVLFNGLNDCKVNASVQNETGPVRFEYKLPTVVFAILARNKAHTLPYFLTLLSNLNYPKNRIALWLVLICTIACSNYKINTPLVFCFAPEYPL